jgi:hypothetical protein
MGFIYWCRMEFANHSMRCNTPAAIGTLLIARYGLETFKSIQNVISSPIADHLQLHE